MFKDASAGFSYFCFLSKNSFLMKKRPVFVILAVSVFALSMISCVSGKKFREMQYASRQNMMERDDFKTENLALSMRNREIESKIGLLEKDMDDTRRQLSLAENERNRARDELGVLSSRFNDLLNAQEDLIRGNVSETKKLLSELQSAQENLKQKEDIMRQLEHSMDLKKISLDELTMELDKKNARLAELEKILDSQKRIVDDLKEKVSDALLGYENNGLTVTNKNGKVYVSLEEKLLFKTASWDIDANGRNALRKLAVVLERNPGIQIMIEGHTDDVPYNPGTGQLRDNWDLSVKRATTVVRVLLEGARISPERLTAAGRSEYVPVEASRTPDARQKNRRTEIILTPDLSELYDIINRY